MACCHYSNLAIYVTILVFHSSLVGANLAKYMCLHWGSQHLVFQGGKDDVRLTLDQVSGSGIQSKRSFLFGSVEMHIKLAPGNSAGTVTAYFLYSNGEKHDEIDFEFLGNRSGHPYIIHTNVFTEGGGGREQQFHPWFDPTADYHNYTIHWSPSQIVWYVDSIPIRVYKNYKSEGIPYPNKRSMRVYASIWNADSWATRGGLDKIDWSEAPFIARLRHFRPRVYKWWRSSKHSQLNKVEQRKMIALQNKYMVYNYCSDSDRFKGLFPGECLKPQY